MRNLTICLGICMLLSGSIALADAPLPPPKEVKVFSSDKAYSVVSNPKSNTTVMFDKTNTKLWSMPGWFRWIHVSNDGEHLVTEGADLLPMNYTDDIVLATFWEKGKKIKELRLKEIVAEKSMLKHTASHMYWGSVVKLDDRDRLVVERVDGKKLTFDIKTGAEIAAGK